MYDLIIIGGSAAGSAAAVYVARRKLNFKIITKDLGGEVALSGVVNNWLGIQNIQGFELAKSFSDHVKSYNTEIEEGLEVKNIEIKNNTFIITSKNAKDEIQEDETKAVIIASGIHPRKLGIPGEEEFNRKGVTYCTVCDGPLFKGKTTATIGAGNSALESALMMAGISQKVYLITRKPNNEENNGGFPKGEQILIDKIKQNKNIEIIYNADTTEILGNTQVSGLKYKDLDTGKETELEAQGIMVHIGSIPNSSFADIVKKDDLKNIIIDQKCKTNIPGIFAAGDVTDVPFNQIAIAAGQGVTAGLSAIEYINKLST